MQRWDVLLRPQEPQGQPPGVLRSVRPLAMIHVFDLTTGHIREKRWGRDVVL
jgi:hypothetical protein